jgi:signal transduction histidine kinase
VEPAAESGRFSLPLARYGDIALAAAMAAAGIAEALAANASGGKALLTLLATIPLVWRRRSPMAVLAAVFVGAAVSRQAEYVMISSAALAAYALGAHTHWRLPALIELATVGALVVVVFGGSLPSVPAKLGPFVVLLPLWLVGNAIRAQRARTAALAERTQRLENERRLTQEVAQAEERARIARELHDAVAHSVSVMVVQAGAAKQIVAQSPQDALDSLRAVEETGKHAMQEMRRILGVLSEDDAALAPQPTLTEIPTLVASVRDAGLPVQLEITGTPRPLAPTLELTAYRVIQEALTNAVKHSGLAPTRVAVDYRPEELKLEILCDGTTRSQTNGTPGRGIAGMKERVALVGGRVEAGPGIERGYTVRAWLPAAEQA